MKIEISNTEALGQRINKKKIKEIIGRIIRKEGKTLGEIRIEILDDREILKINKKFLNHDYYTDVIAFSYNKRNIIYGDVCIGKNTVERNARKYNVQRDSEMLRVIIHGVLHLLGYSDKETKEAKIMRLKEDTYLKEAEKGIHEAGC